MNYLVDTDWIIDALAPMPSALDALDKLASDGMAVSIITLGELYEGAVRSPDPEAGFRAIRGFLVGFSVLNLSEAIVEVFAQVRADLRQRGLLIADLDLLIAATALSHELVLVTRNRRHFERIPGLLLFPPS